MRVLESTFYSKVLSKLSMPEIGGVQIKMKYLIQQEKTNKLLNESNAPPIRLLRSFLFVTFLVCVFVCVRIPLPLFLLLVVLCFFFNTHTSAVSPKITHHVCMHCLPFSTTVWVYQLPLSKSLSSTTRHSHTHTCSRVHAHKY